MARYLKALPAFVLAPTAMTSARLSVLTALGLACLASTVLLVRTAPPRELSILDRIYS